MSDLKAKLTSQLNKVEEVSGNYYDLSPEGRDNSLVPIDAPNNLVVPEFAISFIEAKNRMGMLQTFVKELMIPGLDYGLIPGCPKPSLFKSGAEKLCDIYGFSKTKGTFTSFQLVKWK